MDASKRYNVLWVEDVAADVPPFAKAVCEEVGADCYVAPDYEKALAVAKETRYDLFLLDIEITDGGMTGIEFAKALRENEKTRQTPILFISEYRHHSQRLLRTVFNCRFLAKPYTADDLKRELRFSLGILPKEENGREQPTLVIPLKRNESIAIHPESISSIEFKKGGVLLIRRIEGEALRLPPLVGRQTALFSQIKDKRITCLRQIYRTIVVNRDRVKKIRLQDKTGQVWLFNEQNPKPLGFRYRKNLADLMDLTE
ncbi:MAG: response regulator [Clostridia bacterium]|nr:response regulator [Clostridia bacterium]